MERKVFLADLSLFLDYQKCDPHYWLYKTVKPIMNSVSLIQQLCQLGYTPYYMVYESPAFREIETLVEIHSEWLQGKALNLYSDQIKNTLFSIKPSFVLTKNKEIQEICSSIKIPSQLISKFEEVEWSLLSNQQIPPFKLTSNEWKYWNIIQNLEYHIEGKIVKGFGRGSRTLGFPTANLDFQVKFKSNEAKTSEQIEDNQGLIIGVFCGWAALHRNCNSQQPKVEIYKAAISIGYNDYFKGKDLTVEVHLLNKFEEDFYGEYIKLICTAYLRPMTNFSSLENLVQAIQNDIDLASQVLDNQFSQVQQNPYLLNLENSL